MWSYFIYLQMVLNMQNIGECRGSSADYIFAICNHVVWSYFNLGRKFLCLFRAMTNQASFCWESTLRIRDSYSGAEHAFVQWILYGKKCIYFRNFFWLFCKNRRCLWYWICCTAFRGRLGECVTIVILMSRITMGDLNFLISSNHASTPGSFSGQWSTPWFL